MLSIAAVAIAVALATSAPRGTDPANIQQDPPAAAAPAERTERDEIRRLVKIGQKVTITDDGGRQLEGRIGALGPDRLSVASRTDVTELAYERIVRIDRPHDGLGNGALWGFGVGAGLGLALVVAEEVAECDPAVFFSCGDPHPVAYVLAPAIIGGLGAAVGVAVDALVRREPSIYRRGSTTGIRVLPTFGRGAAGVALSVRW